MKRNSFISTVMILAATPFLSYPQNRSYFQTNRKGFKIKSGEGRLHGHIKLKGVNQNILDLKVSGSDTDGGLAVFEQTSISQGMGTPLHVHHSQNEMFCVIEGVYKFKVGKEEYELSAGDSIFLPEKIPHAWTQLSKKGKMTVIFQPAGKMEQFFVTVAALDHEPSKSEMAQIFKSNDMEIVGPPLKLG
ncbi:cupin domain-containing protein [Flavobacteriaceae bacterium KMM 6897]|nr:cupin domain-containing protein [Flavobacteriaceae bacterium KMM 6897]MEB8344676.1 cupin domain-containing protein [Flavobacteriaceae bacterium KMM 6898]